MGTKPRTSSFGHVERLDSGRWRARYTGPDRLRRSQTFDTKTDARRWLATAQADVVRRAWRAPELGERTVGAYAKDYLARSDLRASTRQLYEGVWRLHLRQTWESVPVRDVTPQAVRQWHEAATRSVKPTALVQAYRLLRALLNVAVGDEVISTNPCRVRAAGVPKSARPSRALTASEVHAVTAKIPARYQALVQVTAFGGLRFGEATALRRRDVAPTGDTVTVTRSVRRISGKWVVGPPKTEAGRRTVALPPSVATQLAAHLGAHVAEDQDSLVFGTKTGSFLAVSNFHSTFHRAATACGLAPVRVHELRHTGATLAAATGASTAELMHRLGHSSPAAALIYQHATSHRDVEIARALDGLATKGSVVRVRARRKSPRAS
jgi:integrase